MISKYVRLCTVFIIASCQYGAPKSWVIYPSQSGVFKYLDTDVVPKRIVAIAIEITRDVLANRNIPVTPLPKQLNVYSIANYFACDGNPYNLDNVECNGVTLFADYPDYIETWVNTNRGNEQHPLCWADTSLVHELMHTLLANTDEGHERENAWSDRDPTSIVSEANAELRARTCVKK